MRLTRTKAVVVGAILAVTTACGGNAGSEDIGKKVEADKDAAASLPADSHMKEFADKGEVTIGVKFDQPGLGFKDAASDVPTGFGTLLRAAATTLSSALAALVKESSASARHTRTPSISTSRRAARCTCSATPMPS